MSYRSTDTREKQIDTLIAGALSRIVSGNVYLIFFDGQPRLMDMTGKTYEEIKALTKNVRAGGSDTSIGCGLALLRDRGIEIDWKRTSTGSSANIIYFTRHIAGQ